MINPALPRPPSDYDPEYMARLVQAIEQVLTQLSSGDRTLAVSRLILTDLPTSTTNLEQNTVYRDGTDVRITS